MAARTSIPTCPVGGILVAGDNVHNFVAGSAITMGQVVSIAAAGESWTVHPCILASGQPTTQTPPVGIALNSQATIGGPVSVAGLGCICYASQDSDNTDIDAGDIVIPSANGTGGGYFCATAGGQATENMVGRLLEDSHASALTMERILVLCGLTTVTHA